MRLEVSPDDTIVFDLDDTLYPEVAFVRSGFAAVAAEWGLPCEVESDMWKWFESGEQVFDRLIEDRRLGTDPADLLDTYRLHDPQIALAPGVEAILTDLVSIGCRLACVTDGRSVTQRNKLRALGVLDMFDPIVISEEIGTSKPDVANFQAVQTAHPDANSFTYIADNPIKDFVGPNTLGWRTIQVRNTRTRIHPEPDPLPPEHRPRTVVRDMNAIFVDAALATRRRA